MRENTSYTYTGSYRFLFPSCAFIFLSGFISVLPKKCVEHFLQRVSACHEFSQLLWKTESSPLFMKYVFCGTAPSKSASSLFPFRTLKTFHYLLTHVVSDKKLTDIPNCSFLFIMTYSFSGCF